MAISLISVYFVGHFVSIATIKFRHIYGKYIRPVGLHADDTTLYDIAFDKDMLENNHQHDRIYSKLGVQIMVL